MGNGQSPRQDRSCRRRDALLRATIELLGESGAKSVTHRAVAERAGLPLASTTYYFRSVHQLIEEALKVHAAERVAELQGLAAAALGARDAESTAEAFVALVDGFALHWMARARDPSREAAALTAAMRALFLEQVMDPADRAALHERLRRPLAPPVPVPLPPRPH